MRMWMVNPACMCGKHLRGEHVEHHMFIGALKRKKSMRGFIDNNLLQPLSLLERHDAIAKEMIKRGYKHISPLIDFESIRNERLIKVYLEYLGDDKLAKVDAEKSLQDLIDRCPECKKLYLNSIVM